MPDYAKSAARHIEDAKILLDASRWEGAAYHAGFAVECSLNDRLVAYGGTVPKDHGLAPLERLVNRFAAAGKGRKSIAPTQAAILRTSGLYSWNPILLRYGDVQSSRAQAESWQRNAKVFCESVKP